MLHNLILHKTLEIHLLVSFIFNCRTRYSSVKYLKLNRLKFNTKPMAYKLLKLRPPFTIKQKFFFFQRNFVKNIMHCIWKSKTNLRWFFRSLETLFYLLKLVLYQTCTGVSKSDLQGLILQSILVLSTSSVLYSGQCIQILSLRTKKWVLEVYMYLFS